LLAEALYLASVQNGIIQADEGPANAFPTTTGNDDDKLANSDSSTESEPDQSGLDSLTNGLIDPGLLGPPTGSSLQESGLPAGVLFTAVGLTTLITLIGSLGVTLTNGMSLQEGYREVIDFFEELSRRQAFEKLKTERQAQIGEHSEGQYNEQGDRWSESAKGWISPDDYDLVTKPRQEFAEIEKASIERERQHEIKMKRIEVEYIEEKSEIYNKYGMVNEAREGAFKDSMREIIPCRTWDDKVSYKSILLRIASAVATQPFGVSIATKSPLGWTLPLSEFGYMGGTGYYGVSDRLTEGATMAEAITGGMQDIASDQAFSYGAGKLLQGAGKTLSLMRSSSPKLSPSLDSTVKRTLEKVKTGAEPESDDLLRIHKANKAEKGVIDQVITPEAAKKVTNTANKYVKDATRAATPKTFDQFEKTTGVKLNKVTVADQGSSGRAWADRSIKGTDAERTLIPQYNKTDLQNYANKHFNGNVDQARSHLDGNLADIHNKNMIDALGKKGLTPDDVNYNTFVGTKPQGPAAGDTVYTAKFVENRHAINPSPAEEFTRNTAGQVKSIPKSQQAMLDEMCLDRYGKISTANDYKMGIKEGQELINIAKDKILHKPDLGIEEAAKLVERSFKGQSLINAAEQSQRISQGLPVVPKAPSPKLVEQALHIRNNPHAMGLSEQEAAVFIRQSREYISNL